MSLPGGKCSNKYSEECYWWRFEELHRRLNLCYGHAYEYSRELRRFERDELTDLIESFVKGKDIKTRVNDVLQRALEFEERHRAKWLKRIEDMRCRAQLLYTWRIKRVSLKAGMPL